MKNEKRWEKNVKQTIKNCTQLIIEKLIENYCHNGISFKEKEMGNFLGGKQLSDLQYPSYSSLLRLKKDNLVFVHLNQFIDFKNYEIKSTKYFINNNALNLKRK